MLRKYKTFCVVCGKETRASRQGISSRPIDVCYNCHLSQNNKKDVRLKGGTRKMKKFKFEIQNCITVEIEANNKEEARMIIVKNTYDYSDEMLGGSCYVSDGEEVK